MALGGDSLDAAEIIVRASDEIDGISFDELSKLAFDSEYTTIGELITSIEGMVKNGTV